MKVVAFVLLSLACAVPVQAQNWRVDPAQSQLGFSSTMAGTKFNGAFEKFAASIQFDPANLKASRVGVVIDMASARTGDRQKDEALPGSNWFDAKKFPQAVFRATEIVSTGAGAYRANGTLTIRRITKPVSLPFTLAFTNDIAKMAGTVTIDRRNFGIGSGQWTSDQWVAYPIQVNVNLVARRQP
jgi:polyisoprenoid-binding protein YceI